ncbi:hypothetical protein ACWGLF_41540 [Streptomyces puniciscabiei]
MTAQPEHPGVSQFSPPMRTLAELREALSTWGFPGDRQKFEKELDAIELDDLTAVREIAQAYRHRVLMYAGTAPAGGGDFERRSLIRAAVGAATWVPWDIKKDLQQWQLAA